jgi:hypothetical protein
LFWIHSRLRKRVRLGKVRQSSQSRKTFTPTQLLATFKKTLVADEPILNFDFASFMMSCAGVWNTMCAQIIPQWQITNDAIEESDHTGLARLLLRSDPKSTIIAQASVILQSHMAQNGKQYIEAAYDQSSGRIPKAARPKIQLKVEEIEESRDLFCTMLDYSDAKYSFSGRAMSAYHHKVKPEHCTGGCSHSSTGGHIGGETDLQAHHRGQRIVAFGSAFPNSIIDEGTANAEQKPEKFFLARDRHLTTYFKQHANGKMSQDDLRKHVRQMLNYEIVRLGPEYDGPIPWAYVIMPDQPMYAPLVAAASLQGAWPARMYGQPMIIPVDELNYEKISRTKEEAATYL